MEQYKTVILNGVFDIIHIGHINLLNYARHIAGPLGTVIVLLDSDQRVETLKGKKPIYTYLDRADAIMALRYATVNGNERLVNLCRQFFTDEGLVAEILKYRGAIMVKGEEYRNKPVLGSEYVDIVHMRDVTHSSSNYYRKYSSSAIIEKIINAESRIQKKSD